MPTLPNFGQCWPTSGIQGQWFLICRSCEMHLIHYDVSYPRVIWHVLWAATKIGLLENVLGFRSVLNTVLAVIQWNIPGSLYWTGHWNLVIGLQHESSFNYYSEVCRCVRDYGPVSNLHIYQKCSPACFGLSVIYNVYVPSCWCPRFISRPQLRGEGCTST